MKHYLNFSADEANTVLMVIDSSTSMRHQVNDVNNGVKMFLDSFEDFSKRGTIAVSISTFSGDFHPTEFKSLNDINFKYSLDHTGTALYRCIDDCGKFFLDYITDIIEKKNFEPRATLVFMTDGKPEHSNPGTLESAQRTIANLNMAGVTTAWVAFGKKVSVELGKEIGFQATFDVKDKDKIANFLGVELSQSLKNQSMSYKPLGENFFSQAVGSSESEALSQPTDQALNDVKWFDEI